MPGGRAGGLTLSSASQPPALPRQERSAEGATLQRQLRMAEQGIQRAEQQLAAAKDRLLGADTDAQSLRKQLAAVQAERDALRRDNESSERGALRSVGGCSC